MSNKPPLLTMSHCPYDIITFDCYGTLIDWEEGSASAFEEAARNAGVSLDRASVLERYARFEPLVQAGGYKSYANVMQSTARQVAASLGWAMTEEESRFLPQSVAHWKPFPDTNSALRRLIDAGISLGILSNVDEDLLTGTLVHLDVPFDLLITAEDVQSYKPAHGHFEAAKERIGDKRWLHAAQSYMHDIEPAFTLKIPCAWINRKKEMPLREARPDIEFDHLAGLADWLTRKQK